MSYAVYNIIIKYIILCEIIWGKKYEEVYYTEKVTINRCQGHIYNIYIYVYCVYVYCIYTNTQQLLMGSSKGSRQCLISCKFRWHSIMIRIHGYKPTLLYKYVKYIIIFKIMWFLIYRDILTGKFEIVNITT